ncbi:MAG: DNA methyltransferase [Alphaproteobacteria bacterium]
MEKLQVIYKDPRVLKPRPTNPRTHSKRQIEQLKTSIREFGFVRPVLIDGEDGIIAGHGSTLAAIALGMTDIPTVRADHLTPAQIRAYVIADNKLAENAGWDRELLALELKELSVDLDFDVTVTGFELPEIDLLFGELEPGKPDKEDEVLVASRDKPAVTKPGDLWQIGEHRLLCGDSTRRESYERLMQDMRAQAIFTDPPYNVPIAGHVSGHGKVKHHDFTMASGEMTPAEFTRFLSDIFQRQVEFSVAGSLHYICMDWRHMGEVLAAGAQYSELKNLCVWAKTNAGMGSLYRSQHELIFVFKNGTSQHINNVELGRFGRNRTNLWTYAGANAFGKDRETDLAMHPTVKPVALVADAILDCSHRGDAVLDAFAGSGTTLIAAEKTGRRGLGIEIDPYYADTILHRFQDVYGIDALNAETGQSFGEAEQLRTSGAEAENV